MSYDRWWCVGNWRAGEIDTVKWGTQCCPGLEKVSIIFTRFCTFQFHLVFCNFILSVVTSNLILSLTISSCQTQSHLVTFNLILSLETCRQLALALSTIDSFTWTPNQLPLGLYLAKIWRSLPLEKHHYWSLRRGVVAGVRLAIWWASEVEIVRTNC